MKANIEIDLDEIFFEAHQNEESGREVIRAEVVNNISKRLINGHESNLSKEIQESSDEIKKDFLKSSKSVIEERIRGIMDTFLSEKIVLTDKWGDNIEDSGKTLEEIIKSRLRASLDEKVDKNGNPSDSYNAKCTRIEYLTGVAVENAVNERMVEFTKDLNSKVEQQVSEVLKQNVTDNITSMVLENIKPLAPSLTGS